MNKKRREEKKPECVMSYNNFMCDVDKMDQLMSYYSLLQKNTKMVLQSCVTAPQHGCGKYFDFVKQVGWRKVQLKECNCFAIEF